MARATHPVRLAKIPYPTVVIVNHSANNARVGPIKACVSQKAQVLPESPDEAMIAALATEQILLHRGRYEHQSFNEGDYCAEVDSQSMVLNPGEFVDQFNQSIPSDKPFCALSVQDGIISFPANDECGSLQSAKEYGRLSFYAQAGIVLVHAGLLDSISEPGVVSDLIHELAHYYLAHAASLAKFKHFFFL